MLFILDMQYLSLGVLRRVFRVRYAISILVNDIWSTWKRLQLLFSKTCHQDWSVSCLRWHQYWLLTPPTAPCSIQNNVSNPQSSAIRCSVRRLNTNENKIPSPQFSILSQELLCVGKQCQRTVPTNTKASVRTNAKSWNPSGVPDTGFPLLLLSHSSLVMQVGGSVNMEVKAHSHQTSASG